MVLYNLTGSFNSGYEFNSWSKGGSGSIANTGILSTTYTVNGNGTITLNGKSSAYDMPTFTKSLCSTVASNNPVNVKDVRDGNIYTARYINGECWMTQNLRLSGGRTLTSTDSNVSYSYYLPSTSLIATPSASQGGVYNSNNSIQGYYYNFCAASAGTICSDYIANDSIYDICPINWELPSASNYSSLKRSGLVPLFEGPTYGGWIDEGEIISPDQGGNLWTSSSLYGGDYRGCASFTETGTMLGTGNSAFNARMGAGIRCIRKN